MILTEIENNIYHVKFENQYQITSTFMRLQEFYESSHKNIKHHFFTVEEYMDIYAKENGNFSYYID